MKKLKKLALSALTLLTTASVGSTLPVKAQEERHYTAFIANPGVEISENTRINDAFAEEFGWRVKVTWLTGQTAKERIGVMVAGGEYPDIVEPSDARNAMIDAGAFIPLEDYLDDYPNLKGILSDVQWEKIKADNDGHIYTIPQFAVREGNVDTKTEYGGEAFWIQKRILKWADYPEIKTLDEYFKLIEDYLAENPETDGQKNIGFEIISDDWRAFALENPPMFLAGHPNEGAAIVDPETKTAHVYDQIPEAKQYFKKLSEEYSKGIIDPETFTSKYDQYIAKLSSGRVLGMVDQGWNFQQAEDSLISQGKDELTYAPLGLTMNPDVLPQYREGDVLSTQGGIGITVSAKDVEGILQMWDDMVSEKGMILRGWGVEGEDYLVDEDGMFYRTEEQWDNWRNPDYVQQNGVPFGYMPQYTGLLPDGKNTVSPGEQPSEYRKTLSEIDKEMLDAYGVENSNQMMRKQDPVHPWFPLYTARGKWTSSDPAGIAFQNMNDVKMQWLPKIIMDGPDKFEKNWEDYMNAYNAQVDVEAYESALTEEVQRRYDLEQELIKKAEENEN
ncbi:sugar ABC transporter substrate-binding protein [Globicatella sp. HMSC072A10]|uniref:extracellular solute-binding protein n=1 Tax=Globicatella sp. HMSC072A10 TaxID=1739315 RepID=UPI0008CCC6D9|nr:extracellular solute-binding protein [Globicatella sp. HMSC072A10]OFK60846.1 sugar ABC transporter substrate-binding protein [Globicatella sp. HMSC072A10]